MIVSFWDPGPILRGYLLLFSGRVCSHDIFMTGRSIKRETGIFLGMVKDMIFPSPDDVGHISREIPGTPEEVGPPAFPYDSHTTPIPESP